MELLEDMSDGCKDCVAIAAKDFSRSRALQTKAHRLIPGGAHTYCQRRRSVSGTSSGVHRSRKGCHVWDLDGNEFIEYGMGLRAVTWVMP